MKIKHKILMFLSIEFVIDDEGLLLKEHRIVQRGKKQFLQKIMPGGWGYDEYWEDIKTL